MTLELSIYIALNDPGYIALNDPGTYAYIICDLLWEKVHLRAIINFEPCVILGISVDFWVKTVFLMSMLV